MSISAVGAAIGVLLMAGVVGYAVEYDERDGDTAASWGGSGLTVEPIPDSTIESEIIVEPPVIDRTPPTLPDFPRPGDAPEMPQPRIVEPRPPIRYAPAAPMDPRATQPREYPSGADCGTPSGRNGWGAEKSAAQGSVRVTLRIFTCHQYDGDVVDNSLRIEHPDAVIRESVIDYGDGDRYTGGVTAFSCADSGYQQNPYVVQAPFHSYETPGTYTITAKVTWVSCAGGREGPPQTTTVSMPVHRHAGSGPE